MKCIICKSRKAEIPDRESMGKPVKRVCRQCHANRLLGDVALILTDRLKSLSGLAIVLIFALTSCSSEQAATGFYLASRFCYGYADGVDRYQAAHPHCDDESAYDIAWKLRAGGYLAH